MKRQKLLICCGLVLVGALVYGLGFAGWGGPEAVEASSTDEDREPVWVWTDKDSYGIGQSIRFTFQNQSDEPVVYGTAKPVWTVERYTNGKWVEVDIFGPKYWIALMIYLDPGQTRTHVWDQTIYVTDPDEIWEVPDDDQIVRVRIHLTPFANEDNLTGTECVEALKEYSQETQADLIAFIEETGGSVINTFWIANFVLADVRAGVLEALGDVDHFRYLRVGDYVVQVRPGIYRIAWHGDVAEFIIVGPPPGISPRSARYDLDAPADVETTITWGDATEVRRIVDDDGDELDADTDYSVTPIDDDTATLTINSAYLKNNIEDYTDELSLTIEFDVGDDSFLITSLERCFIATAAWGTPMAEEIQVLREFRDGYLVTNPLGQVFVGHYYRVSPPIAAFISEHPGLKPVVRAALVSAVGMSTLVVNTTPAEKGVIAGLLALGSVAIAVWAARRRGKDPWYA